MKETVTQAEICRLTGFAQTRVRNAMKGIRPVSKDGRSTYYDAGTAIRALINSGESDKEREQRLKADIMGVKLGRMRNEQIDLKKAQHFASETLIRLSEAVKYLDGLSREQAETITRLLKDDAVRIADDLATAIFEDGEDEYNGDEDEE